MKNPVYFYEKIQKLKDLKSIFSSLKYKDIELWPSMAPKSYIFIDKKTMGSFLSQALEIIKFIFFVEKFDISGERGRIMSSFLINRKDHHSLWKKCLSSFRDEEIALIEAYSEKKLDFNLKRFHLRFPNFVKIFKIWKHAKKNNLKEAVGNNLDYWHFILLTYYMFKKIDYWSGIYKIYEPKAYTCYSSYRNNDETIMTQICKKNGKKTFTLQNYAILDFNEFNSESVTYENMISDYFLLWGNAGKDILKKYLSEEQLLVVGNPSYSPIKKIKKEDFHSKVGAVSLDYPQYDQSNFDVINIIKEFAKNNSSIKFYFSLHPDLDKSKYLKNIKGKNIELWDDSKGKDAWLEQVKKSDFLVLHNTTMALESLRFQIPILRYKDKTMARMIIPEKEFRNLKEFESLLSSLKKNKTFSKDYYDAYFNNFHQPKGISIPEDYKKTIIKIVK